jgi:predicted transcriptional regulator
MTKTLTIRIKPLDDAMAEFRRAFRAVEAGRRVARRDGLYVTSLEAAWNILTRNRLGLLRAIRAEHPRSICELAKLVGRDFRDVQEDLRLLERCGLVKMGRARGRGARRAVVPQALFGEIALKIAI